MIAERNQYNLIKLEKLEKGLDVTNEIKAKGLNTVEKLFTWYNYLAI